MAYASADNGFDIGRVVGRMFSVIGRNLPNFVLLAALLVGAPTALFGLAQLGLIGVGTGAAQAATPTAFALTLLAFPVQICANFALQGALIYGTVSDLAGRPVSFGDALGVGVRFLLPLFGIAIVTGIGLGVAALLLLIPAIILAVMWCVAAPAEVMERRGVFESISRSADLTRNHRWAIFAVGLLYVGSLAAIQFVVGGGLFLLITAAGSDMARWSVVVVTPITSSFQALIGAALAASIYYELRTVKEGIGAEALASVFD
ncbi:MAG: glycerophosphoryl diester phosphodiesterase membrane domain-containing protein [Caulobacterales bacterium]